MIHNFIRLASISVLTGITLVSPGVHAQEGSASDLISTDGAKVIKEEKVLPKKRVEYVDTIPKGTILRVKKGRHGVKKTFSKTVVINNSPVEVVFTETTLHPEDAVVRVGTNDKVVDAVSDRAEEIIAQEKRERASGDIPKSSSGTKQRSGVTSSGGTDSVPEVPEPSGDSVGKTPNSAKQYARSQFTTYGWNESDYIALVKLWERESNWDYRKANPVSSARGIPQAMMSAHWGSGWKSNPDAQDWLANPKRQIDWGLKYISSRYGTPSQAWAHSQRTGWY